MLTPGLVYTNCGYTQTWNWVPEVLLEPTKQPVKCGVYTPPVLEPVGRDAHELHARFDPREVTQQELAGEVLGGTEEVRNSLGSSLLLHN